MKFSLLTVTFLLIGCNEYSIKNKVEKTEPPISPKVITTIPEGAVNANFLGAQDSIYAYVKEVDMRSEKTTIAFQNNKLPKISIPESVGAELQILKLKKFNKDLLLVNAKLKDTNFNEYYLYFWNDTAWTQPVNRFAIHKSNMSDTLVPIQTNPNDSTQLLRYYSVFDMDRNSAQKYSWRLLSESLPIENSD